MSLDLLKPQCVDWYVTKFASGSTRSASRLDTNYELQFDFTGHCIASICIQERDYYRFCQITMWRLLRDFKSTIYIYFLKMNTTLILVVTGLHKGWLGVWIQLFFFVFFSGSWLGGLMWQLFVPINVFWFNFLQQIQRMWFLNIIS